MEISKKNSVKLIHFISRVFLPEIAILSRKPLFNLCVCNQINFGYSKIRLSGIQDTTKTSTYRLLLTMRTAVSSINSKASSDFTDFFLKEYSGRRTAQ